MSTTLTPISTTQETDYVGSYTRYVYANGHIETDPPGRPIYREDQQRLAGPSATAKLKPMLDHFQAVSSMAQTARTLPLDAIAVVNTADLGQYTNA